MMADWKRFAFRTGQSFLMYLTAKHVPFGGIPLRCVPCRAEVASEGWPSQLERGVYGTGAQAIAVKGIM